MLELPARIAKIGGAINTRTERHGEDDVAALDIPFTFLIEPLELCWLLKSEEAARRLFNYLGDTPGDAHFKTIDSVRLAQKIEGASVNIEFEGLMGNVNLSLGNAKLSKITLQPLFSGRCNCFLTVQVCPDLDDTAILALLGHMNGECELSITVEGYNAQLGLPLEPPKDVEVKTPEQERDAAHAREREIAQQIEDDRNNET